MAKKNVKNFKIEQDELKPMTIGTFESRRKSSIGIFIILTLFLLVVIFLPQISDYVNKLLNPDVVTPGPSVDPTTPITPPTPGQDEEPEFYNYSESLEIILNDITLNNFLLDREQNTLSFKVTNNGNVSMVLGDQKYYLELYNSNNTLIERIKLGRQENIQAGGSLTITKQLNPEVGTNLSLLNLSKIEETEYTQFEITSDAEGKATLVCSREGEKVTYNFQDAKLIGLTSEISYSALKEDYRTIYEENKIASNSYNGQTGIVSTFFEYEEGFNITTSVDLNEAKRSYIFNADTFNLNTEAKVVNFEMEAQGFTCS